MNFEARTERERERENFEARTERERERERELTASNPSVSGLKM